MTDHPGLGRFTPDRADAATVVVHLRATPVRIWKRCADHFDELMREMALLALSPSATQDLPARLVELVDVLGRRYAGASDRPERERDEALAAGLDRIDVVNEVPRGAGEAAAQLGAILVEAEEFCRTGRDLLTLAQPPVQAAFNAWYLQEFVRQEAGLEPTPWPGPWD